MTKRFSIPCIVIKKKCSHLSLKSLKPSGTLRLGVKKQHLQLQLYVTVFLFVHGIANETELDLLNSSLYIQPALIQLIVLICLNSVIFFFQTRECYQFVGWLLNHWRIILTTLRQMCKLTMLSESAPQAQISIIFTY